MTQAQYQKLWHDLAVGLYYRNQAAENPAIYYHWEQQTLSAKLHWQAKARAELKTLGIADIRGVKAA